MGGQPASSTFNPDRPNRLKPRDDSAIRWPELYDKFRVTQDRARQRSQHAQQFSSYSIPGSPPPLQDKDERGRATVVMGNAPGLNIPSRPGSGLGHLIGGGSSVGKGSSSSVPQVGGGSKESSRLRTGLGLRFGGGGKKSKK